MSAAPAPFAAPSALSLDGVWVRAGSADLVRGVTLALPRGATLGVVGESGSGKTVLMRAALGLSRMEPGIAAGTVSLDLGDDGSARYSGPRSFRGIRGAVARLRRGAVGVVFQDPKGALDPFFTVGRQLAEAAPGRGEEWLERVRIRDPRSVLRRHPHELSGGMAQRVMIALALATGPSLLVADEPTTGLDAHLRVELVDLLRDAMEGAHRSSIVISHDLEVIARLCGRLAVMLGGRLLEEGPVEAVLGAGPVNHPYTRWLAGRARDLREGRLPRAPEGDRPVGTDAGPGSGCPFLARCAPAAASPSLARRCAAEMPRAVPTPAGTHAACHALADPEGA